MSGVGWWMAALGAVVVALCGPVDAKPLPYTGVNLAGGEFYRPKPGVTPVEGRDYAYPTEAEYDYFASKGMNVVRLQFLWETLQPQPKTELLAGPTMRLKEVVKGATKRKLVVILDPHNSARYYGKVVGGPEVGIDAFADFWGRLAKEFKGERLVWFGLVNEPYGMPTEQWLNAANAAIAAIRKAGARNLILVPGNQYTGAHSWTATWYNGPNSKWMRSVVDPANNYVFEVHQYLDSDSSGTHRDVVSPTVGSERLKAFVAWCRENHKRAFLGEFAVAPGETQRAALEDMLASMERDRDVWLGWTWWAAGPRWGEYMFTLEPKDGVDRPQMAYLAPHLQQR